MREKRNICVVLVLAIVLFSGAIAQGGVIYTRLIDTSFIMTKWYDYLSGTSGKLNFNSTTAINGEKKLYTYDDVYTLSMSGTFTFNPYLGRDYSAGGLAKGYFDGGAIVTITGGLMVGTTYVYGGTGTNAKQIFQAVMLPLYEDPENPLLNRWSLAEDPTESGRFNRTLLMEMASGSEGLAAGLTLTSGDILKMTGPKLDLYLKTTADVSNFYVDMGPVSYASPVKITGLLPEPATILLLGLGTLCSRKKR
jgi:hypothetical protein